MTLPPLTVIAAGAGSGKTHTITQQLGDWVSSGRVAPERIVAVTFTEAAAAEMRERIRARLLELGRLEDAIRLDQAFISTIHGFGLRLLTEYAFEAGISPRPRLLNEDEEHTLIRLALARTDQADVVTRDLEAFGYRYDHTGKGPETQFRERILDIVALLRAAGWRQPSPVYAAEGAAWIRARYGPTGKTAALTAALEARVRALLAAFPTALTQEFGTSRTAKDELHRDFRNLCRAADGQALASDWALWQALRKLRLSKRGARLPDGYDDLAAAVSEAAGELPRHPGPLAQALTHAGTLIAAGQEVLVHYAQAKRAAGLVDYADMIAAAAALLRDQPEVIEGLAKRVDCLVVDEFQDTNPAQFALLWRLHAAGVPALVVGDLKQAIMGFQRADPRLFAALAGQYPEATRPLTDNWRSQPALMAFVNALGAGLFGDAYVALTPRAPAGTLGALEVVRFATKVRSGQHAVRAAHLARRIQALLRDTARMVRDRRTGRSRRLRGSDLAVLCPTHAILGEYAAALRARGLPVRLEETGWFGARAVQIAWHALAYVANPADRHAALYLAVTELGSLGLEEGLRQFMDTGRIRDPLLERLDALASGVTERTVYALVADVIANLQLFDVVCHWADGPQARADLLRLLTEAGAFMDANREAMACGGFHGEGVQSFLAWLDARRAADDGHPAPRVVDEDAVELVTWHSAKGREWPVVAVCGLDRKIEPRLPHTGLGYRTFDDLSRLLENATIEFSPEFAAPEASDRFRAGLLDTARAEARRLLYVAMTRARERLILEWPEYLAGSDDPTYWSVLTTEAELALTDPGLRIGAAVYPCETTAGDTEVAGAETTGGAQTALLPAVGRRAIRCAAVPADRTPDSVTPSALAATPIAPADGSVAVLAYGEGLDIDTGLSPTALGTFLHRCFEVLGAKPEARGSIAAFTGVPVDAATCTRVAAAVARFEHWLEEHFAPLAIDRELPLLAIDARGSVLSGSADLVVRTRDGAWVLDHKSDRAEAPARAFHDYRPQLEAYAQALAATGEVVCGIGIHWIRRGVVMLARWGETGG